MLFAWQTRLSETHCVLPRVNPADVMEISTTLVRRPGADAAGCDWIRLGVRIESAKQGTPNVATTSTFCVFDGAEESTQAYGSGLFALCTAVMDTIYSEQHYLEKMPHLMPKDGRQAASFFDMWNSQSDGPAIKFVLTQKE
jgi:hypothetical protein